MIADDRANGLILLFYQLLWANCRVFLIHLFQSPKFVLYFFLDLPTRTEWRPIHIGGGQNKLTGNASFQRLLA